MLFFFIATTYEEVVVVVVEVEVECQWQVQKWVVEVECHYLILQDMSATGRIARYQDLPGA